MSLLHVLWGFVVWASPKPARLFRNIENDTVLYSRILDL